MTERGSAVLGFKLLGLWLMTTGLIQLARVPSFYQTLSTAPVVRAFGIASLLSSPLVSLLAGCLLWLGARRLARDFSEADPAETRSGLRTPQLFALALSVIGVLQVVEALSELTYGLTLLQLSLHPVVDMGFRASGSDAKARIAAALVRLAVGLVLLAGPTRLAAVARGVRREMSSSLREQDSVASEVPPPSKGGV